MHAHELLQAAKAELQGIALFLSETGIVPLDGLVEDLGGPRRRLPAVLVLYWFNILWWNEQWVSKQLVCK